MEASSNSLIPNLKMSDCELAVPRQIEFEKPNVGQGKRSRLRNFPATAASVVRQGSEIDRRQTATGGSGNSSNNLMLSIAPIN